MKVGSIVLTAEQGLGILAKGFYDAGLIDEILIKRTNNPQNPEWFDSAEFIGCNEVNFIKAPDPAEAHKLVNFLSKIDLLLLFEIPFFWTLYDTARSMGVKTCLMPMYEVTPNPQYPDYFLCPSRLDLDFYRQRYPESQAGRLVIPPDSRVEWKLRNRAKIFVHNTGNGGTFDRNGTKDLIQAMEYVKSPIKLIVRSQREDTLKDIKFPDDSRIDLRIGTVPFEELWSTGDVFIFPEKFNGLSLPIQEAYASGMAVMCGDRYPFNSWLPRDPMIPIKDYDEAQIVDHSFKRAIYDPKDIAVTIDAWYNKDISKISLKGRDWAAENSWEIMKEKYLELFASIVYG